MAYIRAVLFDLWGTLITDTRERNDERARIRLDRLAATLARRGHRYQRPALEDAFERFSQAHGELHRQELDVSARGRVEMFVRALDPDLERRLDSDVWRDLDRAFFTVTLELPPLLVPGALETLRAARAAGLRTGLISNTGITPGFVLRQILQQTGLLHLLDVLSFSDELLAAKPAARLFQETLTALDIPPPLAVFVGDMPVLDVLGPRRVGMWAVQVGRQEMDGVQPHARIESVAGLLPALVALDLLPAAGTHT